MTKRSRAKARIAVVLLLAIALLLLPEAGAGAPVRPGPVARIYSGNSFTGIVFERGEARVSMAGPGALHVRVMPKAGATPFPSFSVMESVVEKAVPFEEAEDKVTFSTGLLTLVVHKSDGRMEIQDASGAVIISEPPGGGVFFDGKKWAGCKKLSPVGERYFGFGEKTGPLDKRGLKMVMWNSPGPLVGERPLPFTNNLDPLFNPDRDQLYQSHPFFMAIRGGKAHGLFFDNTFRSEFDMAKSDAGTYEFKAGGGDVNYWVLAGPTPKDVLLHYGSVVGTTPLPPLWGIGYHQGRVSYRTADRVRELRDGFIQNDVPLDAIHLDVDHMDGYRVFTIDRSRFPDPAGLIEELKTGGPRSGSTAEGPKQGGGVRTVAIVSLGVKVEPGYQVYDQGITNGYFFRGDKNEPFTAMAWPGAVHFPDFFRPEVGAWWAGLHKFYLDLGVDGFTYDMNEPAGVARRISILDFDIPLREVDWEKGRHGRPPDLVGHDRIHNVYALLQLKAAHQGALEMRPGKRPFLITRAGFAGIQRYALVWTGDNPSTWDSFATTIPMLLNMGLSGIAFAGADVGGFSGSPSKELYARWIEAGAFYPFCRTHTAANMPDQEPWSFGPEVTEIARRSIKLRYALLPYTYSAFEESSRTNWPVMRPLLLEFPQDSKAYDIEDQYMWGEWLMAAPVVEKGREKREVYFPAGTWYDWNTGERIEGPATREVDAPLGRLPLYVRAGAIIPMAPEMSHTGQMRWDPLTVAVFPDGAATSFTLYEDDGESFRYKDGAWARTTFHWRRIDGGVEIRVDPRQGAYNPGREKLNLRIHGQSPEAKALWIGPDGKTTQALAATYDKTTAAWLIQIDCIQGGQAVRLIGQ